jgi:DNA polymerase-3 subunit epsilon
MSKLFFYDLETTGVKYWRNGIHQISGAIVIDGVCVEKFNFKVKPFEGCTIEEEALTVGGVTLEIVKGYPDMKSVHKQLVEMLSKYVNKYDKNDKFHLVGYNSASFDNQFFRAFFVQNNDQYFGSWFWSDSIDVMVLASMNFKDERNTMPDFKQKTVAAKCGIPIDESRLHDAEYDIDLCIKIYEFLEAI